MLSQQKLLIVEDEFLIALEIQRIIEEANAVHTVFARRFAEADSLAGQFAEFTLAIVNPPMDAAEMETAARLVAAGPAIVVCTAAAADLSGTPLSGAETIIKPFADGDLLAACQRALSKRQA